MANNPFLFFIGDIHNFDQYPPLLPILEALFYKPLSLFFSDFFATRLMFITYELMLAVAFFFLLDACFEEIALSKLIAFAVTPMMWMSSVVMAQDEVIGALFLCASLAFAINGRLITGILIASLGVVAGKIFMIFPLGILVFCQGQSTFTRRVTAAAIPMGLIYGLICIDRLMEGNSLPLIGFTPQANFGVSLWVIIFERLPFDLPTLRTLSGLIAVSLAVATIVYLWMNRYRALEDRYLIGSALILTIVFVTFYHVNSEYYIFVVPVLLVMASKALDHLIAHAISILAWAINFFEGVHLQTRVNIHGGKGAFIELYTRMFPFAPETSLLVSRLAFVGLCIGTIVYLIYSLCTPSLRSSAWLAPRPAD
jgi:hypothetical protein